MKQVILKVDNIGKTFSSGIFSKSTTEAVKNVSFELNKGKLISLVGESGSGKTTIARILLKLEKQSQGNILLDGKKIEEYDEKVFYKKVQVVFQDPYASINYFYKIDRVLNQAIELTHGKVSDEKKKEMISEVLNKVGINSEEILGRYPHQLSGGQLQRFLIARILLIKPEVLIADEITSMIDASSRAGILNILIDLARKEGLGILFITHDIGQAQYISDDILVLKEGELVEYGECNDLLTNPKHEYTKHLLSCVPSLDSKWDFEN